MSVQLVLCTAPDSETAARLARTLIEEKLAACVNLLPGIRSIYQWQGKIEDEREVQMLIKTTADRFGELAERLDALHPYDNPEILALDVAGGALDYLRWVKDVTTAE